MRILTAKEFLEIGTTAKNLVVKTYHAFEPGHVSTRDIHRGPVFNIKWDESSLQLSWSDSSGDPEVILPSLDAKLDRVPQANEEEFTYTVYVA